ncbi:nitroreductase family protein [Photobacterium sp. OFAV2-7]|uniref:Acg family FMN-binding oxidoreductase n=1 Tax=Photobacterium sp. OFAV2-7 TaxID=2917748 RepID=UPI001EF696AD|nr:nitroreductase family protein [Photobacterium sp. OFAV2-7]MCG7586237.1 nitroreductase family protein [Photobacterium sp. OFAV2-7]
MDRRNFIKVIGTGAVIAAAVPIAGTLTGSNVAGNGQSVQQIRPSHQYDDIRKTLISYGMLCANPHNKQPWKVAFSGQDTILLYVDEERLLPETDPFHRQIHIGQGTFIETLVIAATHFGIHAEVDYFPQGEYGNKTLEFKPVAKITLIKMESIRPHPLFVYLPVRQSVKQSYTSSTLASGEITVLEHVAIEAGFPLRVLSQKQETTELGAMLTEAMSIEEQDTQRNLETMEMFRFNDKEMAKYRDGFGLAQNGVMGIKKIIAENFFVTREQAYKDPASFGKEGVKLVEKVTASTQHYGLLSSHDNSRKTQVEIGRLYTRLNLAATSIGVAMHPLSQILEEYDDMSALQQSFKTRFDIPEQDTVQMLFRLGKASATPLSPRREVGDIIV